jgi:hypothetical protein
MQHLPKIVSEVSRGVPAETDPPKQIPSLVFVFGAPLGDNASAPRIMMPKHYGPGTAHNCDIGFYDDDRKNIEHEWLVRHPESPYPPPGLAGESQKRLHIPKLTEKDQSEALCGILSIRIVSTTPSR